MAAEDAEMEGHGQADEEGVVETQEKGKKRKRESSSSREDTTTVSPKAKKTRT